MKTLKPTKTFFKQASVALLILISRLGFLPANFSPLGSYGLFGHTGLFILSIYVFDNFVGGTYASAWVTYLAFLSYPVFGKLIKNTQKISVKFISMPLASFSFFLISNAGVWWYSYPHTLAGLSLCYSLAIPFYSRTLIGDLTFGTLALAWISRPTWLIKLKKSLYPATQTST